MIILHKEDTYEAWGALTNLCKSRGEFKYQTLKEKDFPFDYKGWKFVKVKKM
jgi:hypothetical protein